MKKNILLIGGSYGIGREIVEQLYEDHNIYLASRTQEDLPDNVKHIPFDVTQHDLDTSQLPEQIDGFVYCPGSINLRPFHGMKLEAFEKDFRINVLGLVKVLQGVQKNLKASQQSSVVFFSSVAAQIGMPFHTSVAISKGALEALARSLAAEWAPKIRVNVIAPSITNTPLAERLLNNESKIEKAAEKHPLKRIGEAKDIASLASFLLSDKSSWMTGQVLHADGGMSTLSAN